MKYENIKSGEIATLLETNDKYKTVMLQYDNGKVISVTFATLHNSWKPLNT